MTKTFRHYNPQGFEGDFQKVSRFLASLPLNDIYPLNYSWVRWDWCRSNSWFDGDHEHLTGIWENAGQIIGIATYETNLGEVFINLKQGYEDLLEEMFDYSVKNLHKDGDCKIAIPDNAKELQKIAAQKGFIPTQNKESDAILDITTRDLTYRLPEGFTVTNLSDTYDLKQYNSVLWYGFNHGNEGPVPNTQEELAQRARSLASPGSDNRLKFAVVSPEGNFVSYAGLWYDPSTDYCIIEPAATHPDYRKMGLCRAAIYEGIKACAQRGAKRCVVGSSQQFYYRIGFVPYQDLTYWEKKPQ